MHQKQYLCYQINTEKQSIYCPKVNYLSIKHLTVKIKMNIAHQNYNPKTLNN